MADTRHELSRAINFVFDYSYASPNIKSLAKQYKCAPRAYMNSSHELVRAYRHLYQHGLRAVQFAAPAKYVLRNRLREAFRTGNATNVDFSRIANTIEFLKGATREKGLEHKIVKTLLFVWYYERSMLQLPRKGKMCVC